MSTGILDWLIIGGGVHGTHLSHVLVTGRGEARERVRVVDRARDPLAVFWRCVEATGMTYLRSTGVHHLDLDPYALLRFRERAGRRLGGFVAPYARPRVGLFRAHCDHVIRRYALDALRVTADTTAIARRAWGYRVETSEGPIDARRVVLALGTSEDVALPAWAGERRACHVFHSSFRRDHVAAGSSVAIVGGGISAAQLALALARRGARPTVIARHALREHRFDSDPGWLGPMYMAGFLASSFDVRRQRIDRARHRGSVPPELGAALRRAVRRGDVAWLEAEVAACRDDARGVVLELDRPPSIVRADHLMLATGLPRGRPGGALIDHAIAHLGLPCASCGFPLAREDLAWAPGLYVTGGLAELQLGPTARNIAGARAAGERLARTPR